MSDRAGPGDTASGRGTPGGTKRGTGKGRAGQGGPRDPHRQARLNLGYAILAVLGVLLFQYVHVQSQRVAQIRCSAFLTHLEEGRVAAPVDGKARFVTRRGADAVAMRDATAALERTVAGREKKTRPLSEDERRRVARHELGHALLSMLLPGADRVHKVSIIPRSMGALGVTMQRADEDRYLLTRSEIEDRMTVLLGGRAAEEVFFEDVTTGAADDLRKVTGMARGIVTRYGMSETLGLLTCDQQQQTMAGMPVPNGARFHAEQTAREIDTEARAIVDAAHERALVTIRAHRDAVAHTAETLLEVETMDGPALRRALGLDT